MDDTWWKIKVSKESVNILGTLSRSAVQKAGDARVWIRHLHGSVVMGKSIWSRFRKTNFEDTKQVPVKQKLRHCDGSELYLFKTTSTITSVSMQVNHTKAQVLLEASLLLNSSTDSLVFTSFGHHKLTDQTPTDLSWREETTPVKQPKPSRNTKHGQTAYDQSVLFKFWQTSVMSTQWCSGTSGSSAGNIWNPDPSPSFRNTPNPTSHILGPLSPCSVLSTRKSCNFNPDSSLALALYASQGE